MRGSALPDFHPGLSTSEGTVGPRLRVSLLPTEISYGSIIAVSITYINSKKQLSDQPPPLVCKLSQTNANTTRVVPRLPQRV